MHKINWNFRNSRTDPSEIKEFSQKFKLSYVMAAVLLNRGINDEEALRTYIGKKLDGIHNPMLLTDMEKAVKRIVTAIFAHEKITVYGDYDVDGVTSTALLYSFLKDNGAEVDYYIPDRIKEGYGLNIKAINKISKSGTKLLITVDCGITSVGEVELAKAQKMEVIVTDHHTCKEKIPEAVAVINPKRPDCQYPFKYLAGVGVAFKLMLAVSMEMGLKTKECFDKYVELAAIGTIADVVELQGENRIITDRGLKLLNESKNEGIKALLEVCGVKDKPVNSTTVAFMMAPRINAAGRMDNAVSAAELLLSQSSGDAYKSATELDRLNRERQTTEREIYKEALEMLANDSESEDRKFIVLAKEGWHLGVIGIVASKICELFYKPCILIAIDEDGKGKGSGRSVDGINLFEALSYCEEELIQFGGHALAAGLSLDMNNFELFRNKINKYVKENIKVEPEKSIDIDCSVPTSFINVQSAKLIERLEPFGMSNEKPVFALCGARVESCTTMGMDNKHLRLKVESGGAIFEAVGFSMGVYKQYLKKDMLIDIAFNLDINNYMNTEKVQLVLKDIRSAEV